MNNIDLDYLKSLNYKILLSQKDGLYFLKIKELRLVESGKDLNDTYLRLIENKNSYMAKMYQNEEQEYIPYPEPVKEFKNWSECDLKKFTAKTLIWTFFWIFIIVFISNKLIPTKDGIANASAKLKQISTKIKNLENQTEEEKILSRIYWHRKFQFTRPFIQEFKSAWENDKIIMQTEDLKEADLRYLETKLKTLRSKPNKTEDEAKKLIKLESVILKTNEYIETALAKGNTEDVEYYKNELKLLIEMQKKHDNKINSYFRDAVLLKLKHL